MLMTEAKTRALKENVFAVIVGIECNIPVMIVGMPGTGKTLGVNIATGALRGDSADPYYRGYKAGEMGVVGFCQEVMNPVYRYQCSKDSTSQQIHELFESALRAKQRARHGRRVPVVFIDEAGLPPERMESLKAVHYWIDQGKIFACILANKPLDAAKRNRWGVSRVIGTSRCIQVFRDEADQEDLLVLGAECLGLSLEDQASRCLVEGFCAAFRHLLAQAFGAAWTQVRSLKRARTKGC